MSDMGISLRELKPIVVTIPPGVTIADSIPLDSFVAAKYLISLFNTDEDVFKALEAFVTKESNEKISDTVFSKLGDSIAVSLNFKRVGSDLQLEVMNSELFSLILHFFRKII